MTKIMISLPGQMKQEVDHLVAKEDRTRSEYIREAIRKQLLADIEKNNGQGKISEARKKRLRAIFRSWRATGQKYNLAGLSELVIREREKLASKKY